mmetsp:Transcript_3905/g.9764  ORF Transcript_3905/g.9764 Transcript_3905/m.9764 type:complete len:264 (+) Transcript_3905:99-890(+)
MRGNYNKRGVAKGATGPPTMHLPPHVYELFNPAPPLEVVPAPEQLDPAKRVAPEEGGLAAHLALFDSQVSLVGKAPPGPTGVKRQWVEVERNTTDRRRRQAAARADKIRQRERAVADKAAAYDPNANADGKTKSAFNTLFVGNLRKGTTEEMLRQAFEPHGKILTVRIFPSYAFIEFDNSEALRAVCARGNSAKVDGRRVVVDVERARTVPNWKPQALGGGAGRRIDRDADRKRSRGPDSSSRYGGSSRREDSYGDRGKRTRF